MTPPAVLVLEDDPDCAAIIRDTLQPDHRVDLVADGFVALDRATTNPPDLLVLDLQLPTLDGFEVIRQWRRHPKLASRPIVVVTARVMSDERTRCLALGCAGFVEKPFTLDDLTRAVSGALHGSPPQDG